jgi:PKD repeat protein/murein tripeptide amidase MpaA
VVCRGIKIQKNGGKSMKLFKRIVVFSFIVILSGMGIGSASQPEQPGEFNTPYEPGFYQEARFFRIYFDSLETAHKIVMSMNAVESKYENGYVIVQVSSDKEYRRLLGTGLEMEEIADPLAAKISKIQEAIAIQASGIPGYSCYRTVEETFATAESIAAAYPTLATWTDQGDSWEKVNGFGGYDLKVLKLTNSAVAGPKPKVFYTSAIHAREYTTAELMTRLAEYLVDNYGTDADATWMLDHHEIHLMLQTNPDGRKKAETGLSWRKNTNQDYCSPTSNYRGADLNRNFSFKWNCCGGSSSYECDSTFHGAYAASEPETQAVQAYIFAQFPDQRGPNDTDPAPIDTTGVYLDVHSHGKLVLWPWGWTPDPCPNATQLQTFGRKFAYFNDHTPKQGYGLYPTDGTTKLFAYGELGIAAYTIELGTEFFEDCSYFENTLVPDNMPAFLYAIKAARTPYMTPAGPDAVGPVLDAGSDPSGVPGGTIVNLSASINDTRYNNSNGSEPTQNIAAAEYYVDTPPWVTDPAPVAIAMSASDGSFDSTIEGVEAAVDTTGWSAGQHIIYVRGQDTDGNWGAFSAVFLYINQDPPTAGFSGSPTAGAVPLTVSFIDESTGATSWSWDFGDTGTSTQKDPQHIYTTVGIYTVSLTVTNAYGTDTETKTDYITVTAPQPPVADFSASSTDITVGDSVTFTDLSTNNPTSWNWTFAGGTPAGSTDQNPTITYNTVGTYTVTLTAANAQGSDDETKVDYITVTAVPADVGNTTVFGSTSTSAYRRAMPFTMPEDGNIRSVTMYHNGGSGNLILAVYDGAGSPQNRLAVTESTPISGSAGWQTIDLTAPVFVQDGTSIWLAWVYQSNPGIRYQSGSPGRYQSTQTWSGGMPDPFGSGSQSNYLYSIYATYIPGGGQPPAADFSASATTITEGQSVDFTDLSTNGPTSWSWTFNGGTPSASTDQNPSVTYTTAGVYTVELTAANSYGSDTETKVDYITVNPPAPPVADFTASATTVTEGQNVTFTDLSTNNPTSWSWTFDGGTPSSGTDQNPTVTYHTAGVYTVELIAANSGGSDTETKVDYITVNPPSPGILFETGVVNNVGNSWQTVTLTNTYTSPVVVCSTGYDNSSTLPAVTRVRNASGNSFDVMAQNPSGSALSGYPVHYFVVEEGVYTEAADGIKMEAVKFTSTVTAENNNWVTEPHSFQNSYTSPVVLGQVMTDNDADWSVFWANGSSRGNPPSAGNFNAGKNVGEDPDAVRADETVGYVVFEQGGGTLNDTPFTAAVGADTVRGPDNTSSGYTYTFSSVPNAGVAIVSAAGMDGGNGGWPVMYGSNPLTDTSLTMVFDEDQVNDSERKHTTEQVAYVVFGQ